MTITMRIPGLALLLTVHCAWAVAQTAQPDVYVPSRPETVAWGAFPKEKPPVARVKSGQTVRIDTLSHAGATQDEHPVDYLGKYGVKRAEILDDVMDFWAARGSLRQGGTGGGHILTGPIYVEDAEPGDTLEVQILSLTPRVPYGMNSTGSNGGVFRPSYAMREGDAPFEVPEDSTRHLYRTGTAGGKEVAFFAPGIQVPLNPMMGIMAVVPRDAVMGDVGVRAPGLQGSGPPGPYGGNMDFRALTVGARLFLPVFHPGALFYTGDSHGAQGDGEVSGNALEQSLTGVFRFVLHKGKTITAPRAENDTHYIVMGIDVDLDRSMRLAVAEAVKFLVDEKKLTPAKALSLCSLAVDFHVAEAVDGRQVIAGKIPKALFVEGNRSRF
jgi:acetamidase/formamidase